jgi:hypothetical protein
MVILNANHVEWDSRQTTTRGTLLRDYANENSRVIYGSDSNHHSPLYLLYKPHCPRHHINQRPPVSDRMPRTKLRPLAYTDRYKVPIIFS